MDNSKQVKTFPSKWMIVIFWLLFLASLTLFFNGFIQQKYYPNHDLQVGENNGRVELKRGPLGHYRAPGLINGEAVNFLLDTGATDVSVPAALAEKLNISLGRKQMVGTANGVIAVYQAELDSVQIGGVTLHQVQANINPNMDDEVLLGMSFMRHLDMTQRADTMILEVPASTR